jgi:hypothetical protein
MERGGCRVGWALGGVETLRRSASVLPRVGVVDVVGCRGLLLCEVLQRARLIASRVTSRYPTTPTTSTVRRLDAVRGHGDSLGSVPKQWGAVVGSCAGTSRHDMLPDAGVPPRV